MLSAKMKFRPEANARLRPVPTLIYFTIAHAKLDQPIRKHMNLILEA